MSFVVSKDFLERMLSEYKTTKFKYTCACLQQKYSKIDLFFHLYCKIRIYHLSKGYKNLGEAINTNIKLISCMRWSRQWVLKEVSE